MKLSLRQDGGIVCALCDGGVKLMVEVCWLYLKIKQTSLDLQIVQKTIHDLQILHQTMPKLHISQQTSLDLQIFQQTIPDLQILLLVHLISAYPMFLNPPNQFLEKMIGLPPGKIADE